MKNTDSVIIYHIVHNFKGVTGTVKTNGSVFFRKPLNRRRIHSVFNSVKNVLPADIMPKRRFVELNDDFHKESIA